MKDFKIIKKSIVNNTVGNKIKAEVISQGLTITEFAAMINCQRTNVYDIFKRESIDCGLLLVISKALGRNFFKELSDEVEAEISSPND